MFFNILLFIFKKKSFSPNSQCDLQVSLKEALQACKSISYIIDNIKISKHMVTV
jgi:hypothetical protein